MAGAHVEPERLAELAAQLRDGDPHAEAGALVFSDGGGVLHADAAAVGLLGRVDLARAADPWSVIADLLRLGPPPRRRGDAARTSPTSRLLSVHGRACVRFQPRWLQDDQGSMLLCLVSAVPSGTVSAFEAEAEEAGLTRREREVCLLAMRGRRNHDIALELGCAPSTVRLHLMSVFRKAGVRSRAELAGRFLGHSLLAP